MIGYKLKSPFFIKKIFRKIRWHLNFGNSQKYWEQRYRSGGGSGPGSHGRLAAFKAQILNDFVQHNDIQSVMEFGFGDGSQLQLARYPSYLGVEVSHSALAAASNSHSARPNFKLIHMADLQPHHKAELVLSLDVVYHLIEDHIFHEHMRSLFDHTNRYVIIYSSSDTRLSPAPHVRHRNFKEWIAKNRPDYRLISQTPNRHPFDPTQPEQTSFADFFIYGLFNGSDFCQGRMANETVS